MQFIYSKLDKNRRQCLIYDIFIALILTLSFVMILLNMLNLSWALGDIFKGNLKDGIALIWNSLCDSIGKGSFIIIDKIYARGTSTGLAVNFLSCLIFCYSFLAVRSKNRLTLLFYIVIFVLLLIFTESSPTVNKLCIFFFALATAYAYMGLKGSGNLAVISEILISLMIATVVLSSLINFESFTTPQLIKEKSQYIKNSLSDVVYGKNHLSRGNLIAVKRGRAENKTALKIKGKNLKPIYLRGYVGEVYSNNKWENLSNEGYYNFYALQQELHKNGFNSLSQPAHVSSMLKEKGALTRYKVIIIDGDKRNQYLPYDMAWDKSENIKVDSSWKNYGDAYLKKKGIFPTSKYSFSSRDETVSRWTHQVGKLFSKKPNDEIKKYFNLESYYNVFAYENYIGMPREIKGILEKNFGIGQTGSKHRDYKETIARVKAYLGRGFVYSRNFKSPAADTDFVLNFIKTKCGSDHHYATLATLAFRHCGIPARYVEGFIITENEIKADGKEAVVPKTNNHAWTEIYIDGYGWVPIEITPAYKGLIKETDLSAGLESAETYKPPESNNKNISREHIEPTDSSLGKKIFFFLRLLFIIIIIILVIIVLFKKFGARLWKEHEFKSLIAKKDLRLSLCASYDYANYKGINLSKKAKHICHKAIYSNLDIMEDEHKLVVDEIRNVTK